MNGNGHKGFDFERFKAEAVKGTYAGKPLNGEKGIFAPLLKHFLEPAPGRWTGSAFAADGTANRRNGKTGKKVKSISGGFELETGRPSRKF